MEESYNTGVIYKVTNKVNNKIYIGKANSFVKHARTPHYKHGALGRFKRHLSNANNNSNEIPLLYNDIRIFKSDNFKIDILEICLKEDLKIKEKHYITILQSYKDDVGYNIFIGDNKPEDIIHKKKYETSKITSNKIRALDGKLRQSEQTTELPPNIYKRKNGLFAQIKINGILYNKAFLSSKDTDIEKLVKAKLWLVEIKQTNNEIEI